MTDSPLVSFKPEVVHALLKTVAETLSNTLLPSLEGETWDRGNDCLKIVSRLATGFKLDAEIQTLLDANADDLVTAALNEGKAAEALNRQGLDDINNLHASTKKASRHFDSEAIESYLRGHELGGPNTRVIASRLLAGGRSKVTALVSQLGAARLAKDLVVRQDWENAMVGTSVSQEFSMLQVLFRHGVKVPEPFLLETDPGAMGAPFMIVSRLPGAASGGNKYLINASNRHVVLDIAEQLAKIHGIDTRNFEGIPGLHQQYYGEDQLNNSLAQYADTIRKYDAQVSPLISLALEWLGTQADSVAVVPPALVHGDIGVHNVLYDEQGLISVLDWETSHIGNPAYDLGYMRNVITEESLWRDFMSRYAAAGGFEFAPAVIDYYGIFTALWFYQISLRSRDAFTSGRGREIEIGAVLANTAPQSLASLSRNLHRVLGKVPWQA
jgi:aminoglycoside phosphotransferase (APT) family kinase protein